ncbi:DegT/DnrJ/EryC1/StrS family aminotransferase [Horticoccus luteus]|uniref:DegT/DnrJ/EryC1/StrS family aminotransferase n=1 Tax=Horticoccus luteus TaxID=2862869 RepID=A0A8F9TSX8_9BACT|nr:DegT/DnrJ/EryC1/StrS family aminotransferase [Horticoccus luteus]QYM77525.1 DegT/DnrJ/EryC1/StrS family aminotransferase [Horticoccus luteus]
MKIQFVDLHAQYLTIKSEMDAAIARVIRDSAYVRGPFVDKFEQDYAALFGVPHCISCANGTDALYIAMKIMGVGPGDEVITTAHSWIATSETITQTGARVVFVDTDRDTFTIDPTLIAAMITSRTKGIIPVHLYGQAADMGPIMEIAKQHNLWVMEDCAQSHLARFQGKLTGTFGRVSTFSFYPGKNLGAYGDAGAILTSDAELARQMTCYARHGGLTKGEHVIEGINSRLDGLQAAVLNVKLPHLQKWTAARQRIAARYNELLAGVGDVITPPVAPGRDHVYHLYVIRTEKRDALMAFLKERGVPTVLNYPVALPFLKAYAYLGHKPADFPVAYSHQSRILSLPIYPEMTDEMIGYVVEQIKAFYARA